MQNWVIDYSLSLVNKTGALYLSRDLVDAFSSEWLAIRRWRSHDSRVYSKYERKLRAKCMLMELSRPSLRKYFSLWHRLVDANYFIIISFWGVDSNYSRFGNSSVYLYYFLINKTPQNLSLLKSAL